MRQVFSLIKRCSLSILLFLIIRLVWDWGLTCGAPLCVLIIDWLLSLMEFPLSVGGGISEAGPSNRPPIDLNRPPLPEPEEEVDLYNEKDPSRLQHILEKQKQERYALDVETRKARLFAELQQIVHDRMGENFDSRKKSECLTYVNQKYLSFILENQRDVRRALKSGITQLSKPRPGYCSYDWKVVDLINEFLKQDRD